jgi:hypothetical protein
MLNPIVKGEEATSTCTQKNQNITYPRQLQKGFLQFNKLENYSESLMFPIENLVEP